MMKLINFLFLLGLTFPAFSQSKSGTITYQLNLYLNDEIQGFKKEPSILEKLDSDAEPEETDATQTYTYTTQFDENYFLSKSSSALNNYESILNRKTGSMVYSMTTEYSKTVQFVDLKKAMEELEKMASDPDPYAYDDEEYDDEEEETDTGYHEGFYQELLKAEPQDTVVIRSSETRNILGYQCKKVTLKIKNRDTQTIWYTEELPELNDLSKIHSSIKGVILSQESNTEMIRTKSEIISIEFTENGLSEIEELKIPEGYTLDMGTLYVEEGEVESDYSAFSSTPDFIVFQDKEKLVKTVDTEVQKLLNESKSKEDNYGSYFSEDLAFYIDEKGKITDILTDEELSSVPEKKLEALLAKLKKTVVIQPLTLYGKPTPFKVALSFSIYDFDESNYYDEE